MKKVKSNMSRDFDTKSALRNCMADGGVVKTIQDYHQRLDQAGAAPKPAPTVAAPVAPQPTEQQLAKSVGISIPAAPAPTPPKPAPGLFSRLRSAVGMADGGILDADGTLADELEVEDMKHGGKVKGPGGPTEDKIPAMLSDGEFVMPADSVKKIGLRNLEEARQATHTPVKGGKGMADGGLATDPDKSALRATIAAGRAQSNFGPVAATPPPVAAPVANPAFKNDPGLDARDLRVANLASGQYDRAAQATARGTEVGPGIFRNGNEFSGVGNGDPNVEAARGAMRFESDKAALAQQQAERAEGDRQHGLRLQGMRDDAASAQAAFELRNTGPGSSAALIASRASEGKNSRTKLIQAGEDRRAALMAGTQRRGQDLASDTSLQNTATQAQVTREGQGVLTRGQDLTYAANKANNQLALRKAQLDQANFERTATREEAGAQRAGRQEQHKNLLDAADRAATTIVDGKPVVDPKKSADIIDKINYTVQQMGLHPGDLPPELHQDLIRRAGEMNDREEASKGLQATIGSWFTGRGVKASRDLRNANPTGFEEGALFDNVRTPQGNIGVGMYTRGTDSFGAFDKLPSKEKTEKLEQLAKDRKLRSPRE
jgi:hypothetical protein